MKKKQLQNKLNQTSTPTTEQFYITNDVKLLCSYRIWVRRTGDGLKRRSRWFHETNKTNNGGKFESSAAGEHQRFVLNVNQLLLLKSRAGRSSKSPAKIKASVHRVRKHHTNQFRLVWVKPSDTWILVTALYYTLHIKYYTLHVTYHHTEQSECVFDETLAHVGVTTVLVASDWLIESHVRQEVKLKIKYRTLFLSTGGCFTDTVKYSRYNLMSNKHTFTA